MKKIFLLLSLTISFCLNFGCAPQNSINQTEAGSPAGTGLYVNPQAPEGFILGERYTSALGESCYPARRIAEPSMQALAFCLREAGWELLPTIYMDAPARNAGPEGE